MEAKGGMQHIGEMSWDGRNERIILQGDAQLPQPYAISIYDFELFWTDWTTKYDTYINLIYSIILNLVQTTHYENITLSFQLHTYVQLFSRHPYTRL